MFFWLYIGSQINTKVPFLAPLRYLLWDFCEIMCIFQKFLHVSVCPVSHAMHYLALVSMRITSLSLSTQCHQTIWDQSINSQKHTTASNGNSSCMAYRKWLWVELTSLCGLQVTICTQQEIKPIYSVFLDTRQTNLLSTT